MLRMRNRWIKYTGTLACVCIQCLCIIAQDIDYRELKEGDVLPNGDTVTSKSLLSTDLNLWRITFITIDGKFKEAVVTGEIQKDFVDLGYVDPEQGLISELYVNGDLILYDRDYRETGRVNIHSDFGWSCAYDTFEGEGIPKVHISENHLVICCVNECLILKATGETTLKMTNLFSQVNDAVASVEKQILNDGRYVLAFTNYERSRVHFSILDTTSKSITNEIYVEQIDSNTELIDWYFSPVTNYLYLGYFWKFNIMNFDGTLVCNLESFRYVPSRYNPIENNENLFMYHSGTSKINQINKSDGSIKQEISLQELLPNTYNKESQIDRIIGYENRYLVLFKKKLPHDTEVKWSYTVYELDGNLQLANSFELGVLTFSELEQVSSIYLAKKSK